MKLQIDALEYLFKIESLINIHRDYICLSKRKQVLVWICIVLDFFISHIVLINSAAALLEITANLHALLFPSMVLFPILLVSYGYILIFCAIKDGRAFNQLLQNINAGHRFAKDNFQYNKFLKNLKIQCYIVTFVFVITRMSVNAYQLYTMSDASTVVQNTNWDIFGYTGLQTWVEFRYGMENLTFYSFISILHYMFQYLLSLIKNYDSKTDLTIEQLQSYAKMYRIFSKCSKQLMHCFGHQVRMKHILIKFLIKHKNIKKEVVFFQILLSLVFSITHVISLMYKFIHFQLYVSTIQNKTILHFLKKIFHNLLLTQYVIFAKCHRAKFGQFRKRSLSQNVIHIFFLTIFCTATPH